MLNGEDLEPIERYSGTRDRRGYVDGFIHLHQAWKYNESLYHPLHQELSLAIYGEGLYELTI
jgi:hypothetical protein